MSTADRFSHDFTEQDIQTDAQGKHLLVSHNLGRQYPCVAVWLLPANTLTTNVRVVATSVNALKVYVSGSGGGVPAGGSVRVRVVG